MSSTGQPAMGEHPTESLREPRSGTTETTGGRERATTLAAPRQRGRATEDITRRPVAEIAAGLERIAG